MDEALYGTRDRRGQYRPNAPLDVAPFWRRPVRARAILDWLPGYFLPWNLLFASSAVLYWWLAVPPVETMQSFAPGWMLRLFLINAVLVALFYGAFEWRLYLRRAQGDRFKFNPAFPADRPGRMFLFGSQNAECIFRTFTSGVTIWTLWECLALWVFANGWGRWLDPADHWLWLGALALVVPVIHEAHFYAVHRLIHVPWLYRHVHAVHHRSVNPSPWSSLSMHPVEHLLYFATIAWHLILPSHPVLALYQLHVAGFGAIPGHVGFDRVEVGKDRAVDPHAYGHYLHHKFFEVNYGDGLVPLDRLFGTFHDGTEAADVAMRDRLRQRRAASAPAN